MLREIGGSEGAAGGQGGTATSLTRNGAAGEIPTYACFWLGARHIEGARAPKQDVLTSGQGGRAQYRQRKETRAVLDPFTSEPKGFPRN